MADEQLTALPLANALTGTEVLYGVQSGTSVKISANELKTFANTISAPAQATFSSSQTQSITNAANALAISYDTQIDVNGVTLTDNTKIGFAATGVYAMSFSAICHYSGASSAKWCNVFMKKNNNLIADTSTIVTLTKDNPTAVVCTFVFDVTDVADYYEFILAGQVAGIEILATAAQAAVPSVSPAMPACPSIIVAIWQIR